MGRCTFVWLRLGRNVDLVDAIAERCGVLDPRIPGERRITASVGFVFRSTVPSLRVRFRSRFRNDTNRVPFRFAPSRDWLDLYIWSSSNIVGERASRRRTIPFHSLRFFHSRIFLLSPRRKRNEKRGIPSFPFLAGGVRPTRHCPTNRS